LSALSYSSTLKIEEMLCPKCTETYSQLQGVASQFKKPAPFDIGSEQNGDSQEKDPNDFDLNIETRVVPS
jgi:hypothetical protein